MLDLIGYLKIFKDIYKLLRMPTDLTRTPKIKPIKLAKSSDSSSFDKLKMQRQFICRINEMFYKNIEKAVFLTSSPFLHNILDLLTSNNQIVTYNQMQAWKSLLTGEDLFQIPLQTIIDSPKLRNFFVKVVSQTLDKREAEAKIPALKEAVLQNFASNLNLLLDSESDLYQKHKILLQLSGTYEILPHEKGLISGLLSLLSVELANNGFFSEYYDKGQNPSLHHIEKLNNGLCVFKSFENKNIDGIIQAVQRIIIKKKEEIESNLSKFTSLQQMIDYFHNFYPESFKMLALPQSEFVFPDNHHLQSLSDLINTIGRSKFKNLGVFLKSCLNDNNFTAKLKIEKIVNSKIARLKVRQHGEQQFTNLLLGSLKVSERARIIFSVIPEGKYSEPFDMEFKEGVLCIHYAGINPSTH